MPTFTFNVWHFFHRFTLHAAILPRVRRARAVRMSALLHILRCHMSLSLDQIFHSRLPSAGAFRNALSFESLIAMTIEEFAMCVCSKWGTQGYAE